MVAKFSSKLGIREFFLSVALITTTFVGTASAEQYASAERAQAALGHYARARTMLVEALREFEEGRRMARPDMLIDSEEWRLSLISRTEELNRILDPKPRVTRSGVRFNASPILIKREKNQLPAGSDDPKSSNMAGEDARRAERMAKQEAAEREKADLLPLAITTEEPKTSAKNAVRDELIQQITEEPAVDLSRESVDKQVHKQVAGAMPPAAATGSPLEEEPQIQSQPLPQPVVPEQSDDEIERMVQQKIQERMKRLEAGEK